MITGGISKLAKGVSGLNSTDSNKNEFVDGLERIKKYAAMEGASDTFGSLAAGMQMRIIAIVITCVLWSFTVDILPSQLKSDLAAMSAKSRQQQQKSGEEQEEEDDLVSILRDIIEIAIKVIGVGGGGYFVVKKIKTGMKKDGKSAMDLAIEEELARLREAIKGEGNGAGASDSQKFGTSLDGLTLVELFNSFTEIMAIRGELPRQKDETALEYFKKVAEKIRFSPSKAEMASHYFEDELYGQKVTSPENRKAFLDLILSMMERVKPNKKQA